MNNYKIYVSATSYKKLNKKLQKYNIKLGGLDIRHFLIANSVIDDAGHLPFIRAKRIILHIAGDFDSSPSDLDDDLELRTQLSFGHFEFLLLRRRLEQLVKEYDYSSRIMALEMMHCRTVGDYVEMINAKIAKFE